MSKINLDAALAKTVTYSFHKASKTWDKPEVRKLFKRYGLAYTWKLVSDHLWQINTLCKKANVDIEKKSIDLVGVDSNISWKKKVLLDKIADSPEKTYPKKLERDVDFGVYKGITLGYIYKFDPAYLGWVLKTLKVELNLTDAQEAHCKKKLSAQLKSNKLESIK